MEGLGIDGVEGGREFQCLRSVTERDAEHLSISTPCDVTAWSRVLQPSITAGRSRVLLSCSLRSSSVLSTDVSRLESRVRNWLRG